jgi:predicted O-linked N-acetylglucosamine transferase (SPINDLY family)
VATSWSAGDLAREHTAAGSLPLQGDGGDLSAAEVHLRAAIRLEPKNAEIWNQLAAVLSTAGRLNEAVKCHRQAVTLNPGSAQAWHGYGSTLSNLNIPGEALECERKAIAADPTYMPARRGHAVALQKCHRIAEAVDEYDVLLAQNPRQFDLQSHRLFALNYLSRSTPETLFAAHRAYGELVEKGITAASFNQSKDPRKKLRVAFFSADFREHSVAYFLEPLLRHLDSQNFELLLYNLGKSPDAVTARFKSLATVWRDFPSTVESVIEPVIRADAPDIAVDLGGHTGTSLLPLFARRLAPVQISYLGYPNTTGLTAMDYRLVDEITDPMGEADQFHTEKLLRFSSTAWVYSAPEKAPDAAPPPCLSQGFITFGSFNNFAKTTDETLQLLARLLDAVPRSRLRLKSIGLSDAGIAQQVRERLRRAGLPNERTDLSGATTTTAGHLAAYAAIDVALDPMPYNGTTTTCEALWMGVPVVTLLGNRHAARVGASLLRAAGHAKWIARDADDYVRIATSLATAPAALTSIRAGLRTEILGSTLLDHAGQAARFGAALRETWQNWCAER